MVHLLLVTFPAQGHINPSLQFAKRLVRIGVQVTFVTSISASRRMNSNETAMPNGLSFATYSDGYDDGFQPSQGHDIHHYMSELRRLGSEGVSQLIIQNKDAGRPFTCVVYTTLLSWVGMVAHKASIPSYLLWIQPATVFSIYWHYFNGYGDVIRSNINDPSWTIKFPGLPQFSSLDLPTFFDPSNVYTFALPTFQEHMDLLGKETRLKVLVNTVDALETEVLQAIGKLELIGVGPLIPSAFVDGEDPSDTAFGGDLIPLSEGYIQWLNSQPDSSVIYVAFGSYSVLTNQQIEEIAQALLGSGRPFLWVKRKGNEEDENGESEKLSCREELEQQGLIVPWCSQVEVLSSPSLGCFVTHCGWNSTFESIASGVPVVAFPLWTDQTTNAKLIEDVWKTGVRVKVNEEGVVEAKEIERCLDLVMGDEKGKELKRNAEKWKGLVREAAKEGGSSNRNLTAFVDELRQYC